VKNLSEADQKRFKTKSGVKVTAAGQFYEYNNINIVGKVLLSVNGKTVKDVDELKNIMSNLSSRNRNSLEFLNEKGEKERIKQGGNPISNPSIGMVATHFDIYNDAYTAQRKLRDRTNKDNKIMAELRPTIDDLILELWNVIEAHFANLPPKERYEQCSKFGVIYYYRKNEERL